MKDLAEGITITDKYGQFSNACWVLQNGKEAAVVEMPHYRKGKERAPYMDVMRFVKNNRLLLKYALLSHPHWDHCYTLPFFRARFPKAHFVAHSSFFHTSDSCLTVRHNQEKLQSIFNIIFSGDMWQGTIGGEPVYVIHAPKHSYTDLMIVFRGAMITGDWYIGDIRDCTALVKKTDKKHSIARVKNIIKKLGYTVHMLFSAHGNHLFYDADFFSIMDETGREHRGRQPRLKARFVNG